eukprot:TRINITY_DN3148_c0_g2_i1.p1 TRINITY_DN3148_c0_g2~~TRINITY_DN3148_c0_g2_i1.p1  ORF type:complete len:187 (+),score=32.64 TRINITY_DN3148_c0_g2_i1:436-996(+)
MESFKSVEGNEDIILENLIERSIKCVQNNFTECELQQFRGSNVCPNINLSECNNLQTNPDNCSMKIDAFKAFCSKGVATLTELNNDNCCGENHCKSQFALIAGLSAGLILSIIAITITIICYRRKLQRKKKKQYEETKKVQTKEEDIINSHESSEEYEIQMPPPCLAQQYDVYGQRKVFSSEPKLS